ncbi:hypothetical protein [Pedobacter sp. UC225_65]|uniref:hypothetical protein n=1 Tax=Pedobacter sp. UC225_65 TaxID=3350173 RepID=UPI00366C929B
MFKPQLNRWANVVAGILFTLIMALIITKSISEWKIFYVYLACVEIILTSVIAWRAWNWPQEKGGH